MFDCVNKGALGLKTYADAYGVSLEDAGEGWDWSSSGPELHPQHHTTRRTVDFLLFDDNNNIY